MSELNTIEIKFWQSEAKSCEHRQKLELIQRNNYPFLINYYEGIERVDKIYPHVAAKQQLAIINEYFPNTNAKITELMYQNPDLLLEATKPDAEEGAPLMKSALEYFLDKSDSLTENRIALFDMLYAGYCGVEIDLMPKEEEKADTSIPEEEPKSVFDKAIKNLKKVITPNDAEENLAKMSPPMESPFSTVQGTYIRRYDPLDVPLDWRAHRIKDRRYNLKKVWLSKAEFDAKYPKFSDRVHAQDMHLEFSRHDHMIHNRKILLYEFQVRMKDNKYQTIIISPAILTEEIDTFIRPYTTNGFNMKIGTLHKYGKLYPRSFAQVNKKMSDETNNYVRHMMEVAERNIPKRVYDKNKVKGDALDAMNSTKVNDAVGVDGNPINAFVPAPHTNVSIENKELLQIYQDQKNKLWSVSENRIAGQSQSKFATEIAIQEQAFQQQNIDIQEGLRLLMVQETDTAKDLIASFWDDEVFLKVTGNPKMPWYEPIVDPNTGNVTNPLSDLLTGDYNIKIDIASAAKKNRDQQLQEMVFYIQQIVQLMQLFNSQGRTLDVKEIEKMAKEFHWNPDKLFMDFQQQAQPSVPTQTGETISPEQDAERQAEAQARLEGQ